ncbi:MAG: [Fe-S]-binding protein, partial [Caldilinea sp.]|nr:[Fe-S]-binding protein [Caldilinea sp.]
MLTWFEKILFIVALGASLYYGYLGFRKVYLVIMRGQGEKPTMAEAQHRLWTAAKTWLTERPIWKTRELTSVFHAMVAWGFIFYFLVNFGDILQGLFPITFLGEGFIGDIYRFLADIFTMSVLIGIIYFIVRRFIVNDKALSYRDNIMLVDKVKDGAIRRDSLIVALFILFHVGFRLMGESFTIARHGGDPWQPFGNALSMAWSGMGDTGLAVGQHLGWWLALGLILAFIPYFPYTKH